MLLFSDCYRVSSRNFYDVLQKYYYLYVSGVQISRGKMLPS